MTVLRPRVPKAKAQAKAASNTGVVAFAVLVGGAFFSIPFVAHFMKSENLTSQEKPLNATQIRRGPYQNTGSRDVGVDKDWDFTTNTWNGRKGADALREKANRQFQEQRQQQQSGRDDV